MIDHRMNSIHLESDGRREEFRRARARVLDARGERTIAADAFAHPERVTLPPAAKLASPGRFWLVDRQRRIYRLKVGLNHVGRMLDNDVVLSDTSVSRRHCTILVHSDLSCELHDTASRNGTYLNGQRVSRAMLLRSGDELRLCECSLRFFSGEETAEPPERIDDISKTLRE